MIKPTTIYLITRLDAIQFAVTIAAVILFTIVLLGLVATVVHEEEASAHVDVASLKKYVTKMWMAFLLCVLILVALPSTNEMAAILVLPRIANSQNVQLLGDDCVKFAHAWMQSILPSQQNEERSGK